MLRKNDTAKIDTGMVTEYTDINGQSHQVRHSVMFGECGGKKLEEKIAEDLCRIFAKRI